MSFKELVKMMIESDLKENEKELYLKEGGYKMKDNRKV